MKESQRLANLKITSADIFQEGNKKSKSRLTVVHAERGSYAEKILQAGLFFKPNTYFGIISAASLFAAYIASFLGIILSVFVAASLFHYLSMGYLEERAAKRRKKIVPQLPAFIDSLAAALGTGFNIEAAVIQAAQSVPPSLLRTELDRVVDALNRGLALDEAISILKLRVAGKEITSLAVALNLFHGMGGRLLEPFKRLGRKIREQQIVVERASRDLVQVKQAFIVILLLSVGAPFLLLLIAPEYMMDAFNDSLGRLILQVGVIMQLIAIIIFKKITNLRI